MVFFDGGIAEGGAIFVESGSLTLVNCAFSGNTVVGGYGGSGYSGAGAPGGKAFGGAIALGFVRKQLPHKKRYYHNNQTLTFAARPCVALQKQQ